MWNPQSVGTMIAPAAITGEPPRLGARLGHARLTRLPARVGGPFDLHQAGLTP